MLAEGIIENLEAGLASFREIMVAVGKNQLTCGESMYKIMKI